MCYPVTNPIFRGESGIARKNVRPLFHPIKYKVPVGSNEERRYSELSRQVKKRAGMLDYFKEEEYRNLEALCGSLASFEGRMYQYKYINHKAIDGECHDIRQERHRSLGILNDLMAWFWRNAVIDISISAQYGHYHHADDIAEGVS